MAIKLSRRFVCNVCFKLKTPPSKAGYPPKTCHECIYNRKTKCLKCGTDILIIPKTVVPLYCEGCCADKLRAAREEEIKAAGRSSKAPSEGYTTRPTRRPPNAQT